MKPLQLMIEYFFGTKVVVILFSYTASVANQQCGILRRMNLSGYEIGFFKAY
jgi:hypothetical protein